MCISRYCPNMHLEGLRRAMEKQVRIVNVLTKIAHVSDNIACAVYVRYNYPYFF
jgi:hypothetical protein